MLSTNWGSRLSRIFTWYSKQLETQPLVTKSVTSGIVAGSGDVLCQIIVRRLSSPYHGDNRESVTIDKNRTFRFFLLGAVLVAPTAHHWYRTLLQLFPANTLKAAFQRTLLDQALFAPLFIPTFMASAMALAGEGYDDILPIIRERYADLVLKNWILWAPAQLFNFRFVPAKFQVLFSNCVALVWNTYFSFKVNEDVIDGSYNEEAHKNE